MVARFYFFDILLAKALFTYILLPLRENESFCHSVFNSAFT